MYFGFLEQRFERILRCAILEPRAVTQTDLFSKSILSSWAIGISMPTYFRSVLSGLASKIERHDLKLGKYQKAIGSKRDAP